MLIVSFNPWKGDALDALCVGELAGVVGADAPVLLLRAMGRGEHCRTRFDRYGFPRGCLLRQKRVHGFMTGDLVRADVPKGKHAGVHVGRVAVRASGSFRVGSADGIGWRYCRLLQRADGYEYHLESRSLALLPHS
jgi:hypothetical protein